MPRILSAIILGLGLLSANSAFAQSAGDDVKTGTSTGSNSGVITPPNSNVDDGIHARGSATQQSPDRNADGIKQSTAGVNQNRPNPTNNQLTASPKGPNTGGNDATK